MGERCNVVERGIRRHLVARFGDGAAVLILNVAFTVPPVLSLLLLILARGLVKRVHVGERHQIHGASAGPHRDGYAATSVEHLRQFRQQVLPLESSGP